jgi:hypothetical protein
MQHRVGLEYKESPALKFRYLEGKKLRTFRHTDSHSVGKEVYSAATGTAVATRIPSEKQQRCNVPYWSLVTGKWLSLVYKGAYTLASRTCNVTAREQDSGSCDAVRSAERTALEPLVRIPPRLGFFDEHKGMLSSSWDGIVAGSWVCTAVREHLANYGAMDIVAKAWNYTAVRLSEAQLSDGSWMFVAEIIPMSGYITGSARKCIHTLKRSIVLRATITKKTRLTFWYIPSQPSVHFATRVRRSRVARLSWSSRFFVRAAASEMSVRNSSRVSACLL